MTTIFLLLTVQIVLGVIDNLWHHEITERLPAQRIARYETLLHAIREMLYAAIFACLAWTVMQGVWSWLLIGLFCIELIVTLADFVIEDRTRKLPVFERVLHTVLAVNLGAFLAVFIPHAIDEAAKAANIQWVSHGYWSWFFTCASVGVLGWSVRNWLAAIHWLRAPEWQRNPIRIGNTTEQKHLLITGASGFIGKHLVRRFIAQGHQLTVLTRSYDKAWFLFGEHVRIVTKLDQVSHEEHIDTIINLAGAPVVNRLWTAKQKRHLVASRVGVTDAIVALVKRMRAKPKLLISASAIGFYGIHGEKRLIEVDGLGEGFQAELTSAWESSAEQVELFGTRLVKMRLGLVLGQHGGILPRLIMPMSCRVSVIFGRGAHWMSWIHLEDVIGLMLYAIEHKEIRGALNATAPEPVKHVDFMNLFAKKLGATITLRIPTRILRVSLGDLAQLFVDGQKVVPLVAQSHGYKFRYAKLSHAAGELLSKESIEMPKVVYFDGAIRLCAKEIAIYERAYKVLNTSVEFVNLNSSPMSLKGLGLSALIARKRLYVQTNSGELLSGVEALLSIWHALPDFGWLARIGRLPVIHGGLAIVYDLAFAPMVSFWSRLVRKKAQQNAVLTTLAV